MATWIYLFSLPLHAYPLKGYGSNQQVNDFILMSLADQSELKMTLFVIVLSIYLFTIVDNLGLILVFEETQLNTPMHFFVSKLAFVDLC